MKEKKIIFIFSLTLQQIHNGLTTDATTHSKQTEN